MKSAYELAMERLAKSDPSTGPMTPEQKSRLAEIDRVYQGKLAEREIFLKKQLEEAFAAQKLEDAEKIKQQLASERARIEEDREAEKERVRGGKEVRRPTLPAPPEPPAAAPVRRIRNPPRARDDRWQAWEPLDVRR